MPPLFAQGGEVYLRLNRVHSVPEGWHWLAIGAAVLAVAIYVLLVYRRDGVELQRGVRWSLVLLRLFVIAALVFFFLDLEKGSERKLVRTSRALVLVDTSLSMAVADVESSPTPQRRIDSILELFQADELVSKLRERHDVVIYRFDQTPQPTQLASFPKIVQGEGEAVAEDVLLERHNVDFQRTRQAMMLAAAVLAAGLLLLVLAAAMSFSRKLAAPAGWVVLLGVLLMIAGSSTAGAFHLQHPEFKLSALAGLERASFQSNETPDKASDDKEDDEEPAEIDWTEQLAPRGVETRLGDAIRFLVEKERGGPIAGIAVFTDGGSNAGVRLEAARAAAQDANFPIFAIGVGSDKRPVNVRVVDIEAPRRAFPSDEFPITAYLQSFGLEGRTVNVELYAISSNESLEQDEIENPPIDALVNDTQVKLSEDGKLTPVRFQTDREDQGRWTFVLKVIPPEEDRNAADNHRASQVQVVDRKTQVLLIAGGPSREFRFLRNLLFRDPEVVSHVWLQSGKPGISQESDQLIFEFPEIPDELYKYDCIVAFDPNWLELTAGQVDLLEKWVAEKAGGLVVVAGPVNTPRWANLARGNDRRIDSIKGLYPVSFYSWRSSTISLGRFGGSAVWPIQFSDDGYQAEFLWLSEDQVSSEAAWSSFDGVYGYYAVKDPKPGARIYSRFADPDTAIDGDLPIYMAGHLYGAGRVFFQASGELWRIRALDDTYFQQYYTKLIRWASQGRLLRDSRHGVLLVDKERCLIGDHVGVQAILNDSQHQPLTQAEVEAELVHPKGGRTPLILRRTQDGAREGMFTAQITAAEDGDYRIELMPPGADADELLTRTVLVRTPALETEQPQRNDRGLRALTRENGQYLVGAEAALDASQTGAALPTLLTAQDQTTFLPGVPDRRFAQTLRGWLIALICGALCWEWIIRRLSKLA